MGASVPTHNLLTRDDVAAYLRVCPQTVTALVRSGELACYRVGRNWRFSMEQIETYLSQVVTSPPQVSEPAKKKRERKDKDMERAKNIPEKRHDHCIEKEQSLNLLERIRACRS
jgi:excisionase family DNA binding protein